jgi:proteasome lid subunit RPN8/RPN11
MPVVWNGVRGAILMRWTERPPDLPLQSRAALEERVSAEVAAFAKAGGLAVIVTGVVRAAVRAHLGSSADERGGLLLGEVFAEDPGVVSTSVAVLVSCAVPALDFSSSGISLRMESGVWERARLARRPGELVVGWYHSHPGLGAFFSATDRRTQAAFFANPYSVGWVVDPLLAEEAFFIGHDCAAPTGLYTLPGTVDCAPAGAQA